MVVFQKALHAHAVLKEYNLQGGSVWVTTTKRRRGCNDSVAIVSTFHIVSLDRSKQLYTERPCRSLGLLDSSVGVPLGGFIKFRGDACFANIYNDTMVVCSGGFVASTVASIMMNGVCCLWQMEEEKEKQLRQREAFRRDIRVEYERQRRIEQEIWEARRNNTRTENWYHDADSSVNTDQRRRKLIATKASLVHHTTAAATETQSQQPGDMHNDSTPSLLLPSCQDPATALVQRVASPQSRQPIKKRKVRIATSPTNKNNAATTTTTTTTTTSTNKQQQLLACRPIMAVYPKSPQQWNDMSSLMDTAFHDDDDDDDDTTDDTNLDQEITDIMMEEEEITSLVDVPLR